MRLYLKLAVIVGMTIAMQWTMKYAQSGAADWWFAAQCGFAFATEDQVMLDRLVEEAREFSCDCIDDPILVSASAPG